MNLAKKTSWQIAAVSAAVLLAGVAQAHDRNYNHHGHRHQARHHDGHDTRYEYRYDDRYETRYDNRYDDYYGRGDGRYDSRWHNPSGRSRRLREDLEFWAPPFSPPWLYRHRFFGH